MTDKTISPLRQRLIEDMAIRRLGPPNPTLVTVLPEADRSKT
jgi:hypothetical protein